MLVPLHWQKVVYTSYHQLSNFKTSISIHTVPDMFFTIKSDDTLFPWSRMICCMITDLSLRSKNCWYHIFKELFRFHSTCGNPFSNLKVLVYNRYIHYISSDIIFEHSLYYFLPVFFRLDCGQTTVMEVYVQYSTTNSFIAGFRDPYLIF